MKLFNIIKKPIMTEKTTALASQGVHVFRVDRRATKPQIKEAIQSCFQVKVQKIRTIIGRGRSKKTKHGKTKPQFYKKAIVQLKEGEKISLFEGA